MPDISGQWVDVSGRAVSEAGVVLYVHGGGFEHTNLELERQMAAQLSSALRRPVSAVAYRLAPAHPYPAALEDVCAAYGDLLARGAPGVVLYGESSGGTLVLSALLALRDAGRPMPAAAIAVSPLTDLALTSPSLAADSGDDVISREVLEHVCAQYLAGAPADEAPQSPLYGELAELPPLLLAAGTGEVLVDDARRFADAAGAARVPVTLELYDGARHGFQLSVLTETPSGEAKALLRRLAKWAEKLG